MKRSISNSEFEEAYKNPDHFKLLCSYIRKFKGSLTKEEIMQCGRIALWKALQSHDYSKQKFTTSICYFMNFECLQMIERNNRKMVPNHNTYHTEDLAVSDDSIQQTTKIDELKIEVEKFKKTLSYMDKNIFEGYYENQTPIKKLAQANNITIKQLKERLSEITNGVNGLVYNK